MEGLDVEVATLAEESSAWATTSSGCRRMGLDATGGGAKGGRRCGNALGSRPR
ncbi:MAG: hypothetical protein IPK80_16060 [Nannocystis sp.]|nr:hypothetical protein [Nannocystis sp.]